MEEFQELVKANGEELHCRLIDTTQMWVSWFWRLFRNHLPPVIQPRPLSKALRPAVTSALPTPRSPQAGSDGLMKEKSLTCSRKAEKPPGDNGVRD